MSPVYLHLMLREPDIVLTGANYGQRMHLITSDRYRLQQNNDKYEQNMLSIRMYCRSSHGSWSCSCQAYIKLSISIFQIDILLSHVSDLPETKFCSSYWVILRV